MAYKNKYQRQKQQYSTDGGMTWLDVSPAKYRRGRLLEAASEDCNTAEWREVLGSWFCIGFEETVYRWVDSGTYDCVIGDKYPIEKYQVSNDGGTTWSDTGETRYGEVIRNSEDCPIDYDNEYLTLEILDTGNSDTATVYSNISGLEYKVDNGEWQTYNGKIVCEKGSKIQWRGNLNSTIVGTTIFEDGSRYKNRSRVFNIDNATYQAFGNINSVYDYDTFTNNCYDYENFFYNSKNLLYADNLILPATTLVQYAYKCMFNGCSSLVKAPELPATTLANHCYSQMFKGCSSLITPPTEIPTTSFPYGCCYAMFYGCSNMTNTPTFNCTSVGEGALDRMFTYCSSLTSTNVTLSATTLAEFCYYGMFGRCTLLTTVPQLPATTLANYCYYAMFQECLSLVNAPALPAMALHQYCYCYMFKGCSSLTTAPELPAGSFENPSIVDEVGNGIAMYCYGWMFEGCTSLNYIKMMAVNVPSRYELHNFTATWVYGVASEGTFVKNSAATWDEVGIDGVPRGWTIEYDGSGTRWVTVSGQTICQGNDKYTLEKEQVTTDGGTTWVDTGNTRAGTLIEESSQDCLYPSDYLTITSLVDNNKIYWNSSAPSSASTAGLLKRIYISTDNGATWTSKLSQRTSVVIATLNSGDKMLVKGTNSTYKGTSSSGSYTNYLSSSGNVDLSGNIMSMVYGDNFVGETELTAASTFERIFSGLKVVSAENLILPATTLTQACYKDMFYNRTTLTTAPKLPAIILTTTCYENMFYGCSSLNHIEMFATDISATGCLSSWVYGVAASGTFVKSSSMTTLPTGNSGIPSGWTIQNA